MAVANEVVTTARGWGANTPPPPTKRYHLLQWGHRERQGFEDAPSPSTAAHGSGPKGMGPRKPLSPKEAVTHATQRECYLHPDVVPGTWGPHTSLPGLRDCQRSRLRRIPGKTKTGCGTRQENLQLGIKTEQVQRNKTLICTAAAPGQLTTVGLLPLSGGPVKSWAKLGNGCPQGSAWNSEK